MAFTEIDEKLLVRAYQAGDERAFDTIVRTQYNALFAHALRRLNDHEAAEDAVQDTMLRAYRALPNLDGDLALRAWLHRILTNVCHDEGNRRRRQQGIFDKVAALPEETAADPVDEAVLHDTVRVMSEALRDLPESYREALVLRYVDGLSFREVAEATGTSEENARARVHRGRLALHKVLSRVVVMLAFIIPGLRRTHEVPTGTDQAVSSGVGDHAVSLTTQLTTHAISAAPTMSRLAEAASALPGGKSTLAAAAITAVAAVSVPVAYTVNEVRQNPPPAVAAPAPEQKALEGAAPLTAGAADGNRTPSNSGTTVAPSLENPFTEVQEGQENQVELPDVTPLPAPTTSTTSTTVAASGKPKRVDGAVQADDLDVVGADGQFDVEGKIVLTVNGRTSDGDLSGRVFLREDNTADADDVRLVLDDGTELRLSFRGTLIADTEAADDATYHIAATYSLEGADDVDLAERGDLTIQLKVQTDGVGSLLLAFSGNGAGR